MSNVDGPKAKGKQKLATQFAMLVEQKRIRLIDDDRFISQITCVTNNLDAPETPLGHGDSFISVCLAIGVFFDFFASDRKLGFSDLGNIQALVSEKSADLVHPSIITSDVCKICGKNKFQVLPNGRKLCLNCMTQW